jgi:hypothetical protein
VDLGGSFVPLGVGGDSLPAASSWTFRNGSAQIFLKP